LFATGSYQCADIYWMKNTLANAGVVRGHAFASRTSDTAVATLDKLGLKSTVKKFFRFGIGRRARPKPKLSPEG